jgi:glyoxylase-like metal-dependent hydrolase (beta-lactamase superfamily II)
MEIIGPDFWYKTMRLSDGVTLIHEPWVKPFFRCNIWHVRGRDADILFDTGLGVYSLRPEITRLADREPICIASHTHFDHIGCHHEFENRCVHAEEAEILARPTNHLTYADVYANEDMFDALPESWSSAAYTIRPAPAQRLLQAHDIVDLGDRSFEVIHTPGHSPGGIALWEETTGILLSGDVIYDGPLFSDTYQAASEDYQSSLRRLTELPVSVVHGGHFASFGRERLKSLASEYIARQHLAGCHLYR